MTSPSSVALWECSGPRGEPMSNKRFGYARVSTTDQNEDRQVLELLESGIEERDIYVDKQSGRSFERTNYLALRNTILRKGDVLVVKSIDRFGRNYSAIARNGSFSQRLLVLISLFWTPPSSTPPNIRTCLAASSPISSSLCSLLEHSSRSIPSLRHRQRALPLHT